MSSAISGISQGVPSILGAPLLWCLQLFLQATKEQLLRTQGAREFVQVQAARTSHGPLPGQLLLLSAGGENTWALPNLLQNRVHKAGTNHVFKLIMATHTLQLEADLGATSPRTDRALGCRQWGSQASFWGRSDYKVNSKSITEWATWLKHAVFLQGQKKSLPRGTASCPSCWTTFLQGLNCSSERSCFTFLQTID